jgi:hypothetical protein
VREWQRRNCEAEKNREGAAEEGEAEQQIKVSKEELVAEQLRRSEMMKAEQHSRNGKQAISE